jgi:alkylation response protein AidB-like acyl-CoA dehydrogenase
VPVLNIPEEILELRSTLREFVDREIRPIEESHLQEIQETGTFAGAKEERLKLRKRSAELGFWTLHMPEEVGGGGLSYLGQVVLHEEASSTGLILSQFESVFPVVTGPTPIYLDCTPEQRRRYLDPLMRGEKVTCFALTEPGAGSDATRIQTKAIKSNGSWIVSGRKHFITGGDSADFALVFAVTDPEKRARGGSPLSWSMRTRRGTRSPGSSGRCRPTRTPPRSPSPIARFRRTTSWARWGSDSTRR